MATDLRYVGAQGVGLLQLIGYLLGRLGCVILHRVSNRLKIAAMMWLLAIADKIVAGMLCWRMLLFLPSLRLMLNWGSSILVALARLVLNRDSVGLILLRLRPYPFTLVLLKWKFRDLPGIRGCFAVVLMSMAPNVVFLEALLRLVVAMNPLGI